MPSRWCAILRQADDARLDSARPVIPTVSRSLSTDAPSRNTPSARPRGLAHRRVCPARLSLSVMIPLAALLEFAWANAAPGREAAAQNEALRPFQPRPPSGNPDIEPTSPNDRV